MQIESYLHGDHIYNLYLTFVKKAVPHIRLFSTYKIHEILDADDGYFRVTQLAGKDAYWLI